MTATAACVDCTRPLAEVVSRYPAAARVFQSHRIDFCCHGHQTLEEACREQGRDPAPICEEVKGALAAVDADAGSKANLSTEALIAWILEKHHGYLRRTLPMLAPLAAKVARVHGDHNPNLVEVERIFVGLKEALEPHLDQEEAVLFPELLSGRPDPVVVRRELDGMYADHLEAGEALAKLRHLTDDFTTPDWGCGSYRLLMTELEALEGDLLAHVHLENHVLMPRFVQAQ
jgi:regulator of cell morphogenesis and NO signaling